MDTAIKGEGSETPASLPHWESDSSCRAGPGSGEFVRTHR